jgi:hypothetical protein
MREVVKKEMLKLLKVEVIYSILDSEWASLVQVVPKKGGMAIIRNEKNESIPQRTVTVGVCALIIGNSARPPGRIISPYPSSMKC